MLSEGVVKCYEKAGQIASEVLVKAKRSVEEGISLLKMCEEIEGAIKERGGELAFPCNICINDVAAHYSSPPEDNTTIPAEGTIKIDIGVHVDGYIADTATTISLNPKFDGMVFAVNEALRRAIKTIQPGTRTSEVGRVIQRTINSYGFKPIWNLSGHKMERFALHAGKSIPNVSTFSFSKIEKGDVFAIEPFLTLKAGLGKVESLKEAYIYRFQKAHRSLSPTATKLHRAIKKEFRTLPFSKRWIKDGRKPSTLLEEGVEKAFKELIRRKSLLTYPVLAEKRGTVVAQAEHTVIVTEDGCVVIT